MSGPACSHKKGRRRATYYINSLLLPLAAAASRSCRWCAAACCCSFCSRRKLLQMKKVVFCMTRYHSWRKKWGKKIRSAFRHISLFFLKSSIVRSTNTLFSVDTGFVGIGNARTALAMTQTHDIQYTTGNRQADRPQ